MEGSSIYPSNIRSELMVDIQFIRDQPIAVLLAGKVRAPRDGSLASHAIAKPTIRIPSLSPSRGASTSYLAILRCSKCGKTRSGNRRLAVAMPAMAKTEDCV